MRNYRSIAVLLLKTYLAGVAIVLAAVGVFFVVASLASCGRKPTAPPECDIQMVVTDTLWVEPGHRIGGFVLEPRCKPGYIRIPEK